MTHKQHAALAARLAVGAVLIYAGASKAAGPVEEFAYIIQRYDVLPKDFSVPAAAVMPWLELLIGWSLLLGLRARAAAACAGTLFVGFMAAVASTLVRGVPLPNCGCFGETLHFTPPQALLLDFCLLGLCLLAFREESGPASLDSWAKRGL